MISEPDTPSLSSLLNTLDQFLHDLQDQGIRTVPCSGPLPPAPPAAPATATPGTAAPAPARQKHSEPAEPQASPSSPPPSSSVPQSAPPAAPPAATRAATPSEPPVRTAPAGSGLVMLVLQRLPECLENHAPDQTSLLLVLEDRELKPPETRELLQSMLYAIGYPLPDTPEAVTDITACANKACRIVCMGEKANELFCTLNMGLKLVRGKWQSSPAGRMIATYAPSYLVNNPTGKRAAWNDLQKILQDLGLSVPEWTRKKLSK